MHPTSKPLLAFLITVASLAGTALVSACSDDASSPAPGETDKPDASTSKGNDSGSTDDGVDADTDTDADKDAGAKPGKDANGPGADGDECSFNHDCQSALRCECDEVTGCFCKPGTRGTGKNGVDPCESGNDCASALCLEGPEKGKLICSDECSDDTDCGGQLPRCIPVIGISEPVCTREPPK